MSPTTWLAELILLRTRGWGRPCPAAEPASGGGASVPTMERSPLGTGCPAPLGGGITGSAPFRMHCNAAPAPSGGSLPPHFGSAVFREEPKASEAGRAVPALLPCQLCSSSARGGGSGCWGPCTITQVGTGTHGEVCLLTWTHSARLAPSTLLQMVLRAPWSSLLSLWRPPPRPEPGRREAAPTLNFSA